MLKSICGVILISESPERLAGFYSHVLGLRFEGEDHGELLPHFGVDIGTLHFGIHPVDNFNRKRGSGSSHCLAFNVDSLDETLERAKGMGAELVSAPHDEGFGPVALLRDPEGNAFELVELAYDFAQTATE